MVITRTPVLCRAAVDHHDKGDRSGCPFGAQQHRGDVQTVTRGKGDRLIQHQIIGKPAEMIFTKGDVGLFLQVDQDGDIGLVLR